MSAASPVAIFFREIASRVLQHHAIQIDSSEENLVDEQGQHPARQGNKAEVVVHRPSSIHFRMRPRSDGGIGDME
jgi:hypothetical protein